MEYGKEGGRSGFGNVCGVEEYASRGVCEQR
jgi:hypothetical protein